MQFSMSRTVAVLALAVASCGPGTPACWDDRSCPGETACEDAQVCLSGACIAGSCAEFCTSSAECAAGEACVDDIDSQRCRTDCGVGVIVVGGATSDVVCYAGVVRSCAEISDPGAFCDVCGCGAGLECAQLGEARCDASPESGCGCYLPQPVGGPCTQDYECESQSCSDFARTCRVAAGSACTESDCDYCYTYSDGTSYCGRRCASGADCNGGSCLGFRDIDHYVCRPPCSGPSDSSCDGECLPLEDDAYYCNCPTDTCQILEEDHAPLAPCGSYGDTHCASGACLGRRICNGSSCFSWGYCSDPCTADADCGPEGVCVDIPCDGVDTSTCGLQCLPRCGEDDACEGRGTCRDSTGVGGAATRACRVM